jgi:hypothetical protein
MLLLISVTILDISSNVFAFCSSASLFCTDTYVNNNSWEKEIGEIIEGRRESYVFNFFHCSFISLYSLLCCQCEYVKKLLSCALSLPPSPPFSPPSLPSILSNPISPNRIFSSKNSLRLLSLDCKIYVIEISMERKTREVERSRSREK